MTMIRRTFCNRCGAQIPVAEAHWHKGVEYCDPCEDIRAEDEYSAYQMKLIRRYIDSSASFVARAGALYKMTVHSKLRKLFSRILPAG